MHYKIVKTDSELHFYLFPSLKLVPHKDKFIETLNELWKDWPNRQFKAQAFYAGELFYRYSGVLVSDRYEDLGPLIGDLVYRHSALFNTSTIYCKLEFDKTDDAEMLSRTSVVPYREFIRIMGVGNATFYTFKPEGALASLFYKWREKYLPRGRPADCLLKELVPRQT